MLSVKTRWKSQKQKYHWELLNNKEALNFAKRPSVGIMYVVKNV